MALLLRGYAQRVARREMRQFASAASSEPSRLQQIIGSSQDNAQGWASSWQKGITPWETGAPGPTLLYYLKQNKIPTGHALVPGCGSGYDAIALSTNDRSVVGLDVAQTAVNVCKELQKKTGIPEDWLQFIVDDYFSHKPKQKYDFIYDYLFFAALPPHLRGDWAKATSNLLAENGTLLTLMFPCETFDGGPPYAMSVELYKEHLQPAGLDIVDGPYAAPASHPRRAGREMVAWWKKRS